MLIDMAAFVFESVNPVLPIVPVIVSGVAGVVIFVLVRLAFVIYRSGEVEVLAKRVIDLNPRNVKLILRIDNHQRKESDLREIRLVKKDGNGFVDVAHLDGEPLLRRGNNSSIQKDENGFGLICPPGVAVEAILSFTLSVSMDRLFLAGVNEKGRFVVARLPSRDPNYRPLVFRRAANSK